MEIEDRRAALAAIDLADGPPAEGIRQHAEEPPAARRQAARALAANTELPAADIVRQSLTIAGEICVYTNTNITVLEAS